MNPPFTSLLYTEPRLYDLVFPDTDGGLARMCRDAFRRYLPASPASALDIGCGTAQTLDALADTVAECWGVDLLDTNVRYARSTRPRLHVVQGDMRTVRLGRTSTASSGRRTFAAPPPAPPTRAVCEAASSTPSPAGARDRAPERLHDDEKDRQGEDRSHRDVEDSQSAGAVEDVLDPGSQGQPYEAAR